MSHDEILDALAATQHGVVTRQQLLDLDIPDHVIDRRLASGRLIRLYPGVYLLSGNAVIWPAQLLAACLAVGPSAVASHRAAAHLHELADLEPCIEVSTPMSHRARLPGVRVHRTRALEPADIERRDGIPRTCVGRTIIDLAAVLPPAPLARVLDDALSRRLVTCEYLRRRLDGLGRQGRRGAGTLDRLLDERTGAQPRHQGAFEPRLFELLRDAGLPLPVPQYEVVLPSGRRAYLDFAYPEVLFALEADSYRYHSSRLDWSRDHTRNAELVAIGWRILPVTWDDLDRPTQLAGLVARGLVSRPRVAG